MLSGSEPRAARGRWVLLMRLVLATLPPFAAGVLFSLLTEPAFSARSSAGFFSRGIREQCAASGVLSTNGLAALTLVSGVIAGGIPSVIGLAYFGRDFAAVCIKAFLYGTPLSQIAAATGPHGILEIPALMFAGAAGIAGVPLLWSFANGNREKLTATIIVSISLAATSLAILVPAAIIECHSTPVVLRWTL